MILVLDWDMGVMGVWLFGLLTLHFERDFAIFKIQGGKFFLYLQLRGSDDEIRELRRIDSDRCLMSLYLISIFALCCRNIRLYPFNLTWT